MTTPDDTRAAELITSELESFKRQEGWRDRSYDFGLSLAAALRDSGWVDPDEAATIKGGALFTAYDAMSQRVDALLAERDALLPVKDAAERLLQLKDGPRDRGYELAKPLAWDRLRVLLAAWESREESTDG